MKKKSKTTLIHCGKKASLSIVLALMIGLQALLPGMFPAAAAETDGRTERYTFGGITLQVNTVNGDLTGIDFAGSGALSTAGSLAFGGAYVDFGYDSNQGWGGYMRDTLFYGNLDYDETYRLPNDTYEHLYNDQSEWPRRDPENVQVTRLADGVKVSYDMPAYNGAEIMMGVETTYTVSANGYVAMDSVLSNKSGEPVIVNGAAAVVSGLHVTDDMLFEFPGNSPVYVYRAAGLTEGMSITTEYSSPLVHFLGGETEFNLIFANGYEKWMPAVTKTADGKLDIINLSCTIDTLQPGDTLYLGQQFFQLADKDRAYSAAQGLYSDRGWEAPSDGVKGSPVYSFHPAGVSDNDFADGGTLAAYQPYLKEINDLGFDSAWMLPVFEHPDSSGSVYLPYNMEYIDARYSRKVEEALVTNPKLSEMQKRELAYGEMEEFGAAALELGMNLMMDYVPHGPFLYEPDFWPDGNPEEDPLDHLYDNPWMTAERYSWVSRDRHFADDNGWHYRQEWNAYALDFANPDYLRYFEELAAKQAADFGLSGSRIDAVMGSLPNWNAYGDNRASQTGLYGGALMTGAIRDGVKTSGRAPYILPENNNPTPYYASVTDLFYDMPFYYVTLNARKEGLSERDFAATIAHWLKTEHESAPKGLQHGRFLENHDTVAPWWKGHYDGARATEVYGAEKAKALWFLLGTIDGSYIVYQNDELGNEVFFTGLNAMRREQFGAGNTMEIEYYNDVSSGIIAYRRYEGGDQKLVLVNLMNEAQTRDFSAIDIGGRKFSTASPRVAYGNTAISGDQITLQPYGCAVISLTGGQTFTGQNTAQQYLIKDIDAEYGERTEYYKELADRYQSFSISSPDFEPAGVAEENAVFSPVEGYSATEADGPLWKYLYYDVDQKKLDFCAFVVGGVWRAFARDGNTEWTGTGRSEDYQELGYFELVSSSPDMVGVLTFVAPADGAYTIPAFDVVGVGQGYSSIVVTLKNGEQAAKSALVEREKGKAVMAQQSYYLHAGDTLMFYTVRMDGQFSYVEMDNMEIHYSNVPFTDIHSHWGREAIEWTYRQALFAGTAPTTFAPGRHMDRGMMATVLHRLEQHETTHSENPFRDVKAEAYYYDAVLWASAAEVIYGHDGAFRPKSPITREEMVTMLYRYAQYKGTAQGSASLSGFADADKVSGWAKEAMEWAVANKLIQGKTSTRIDPAGYATRAEVAALYQRFCGAA